MTYISVTGKTTLRHGLYKLIDELSLLQEYLKKQACLSNKELNEKLVRFITSGGKRLRPSLAYLSASLGAQLHGDHFYETEVREKVVPLMAIIEMMHTVSLIHDDIIDNAPMRRGNPTLHSTDGVHVAVHCGNYLLGRTMSIIDMFMDTPVNRLLAKTSKEMCLGEIYQRKSEFRFDMQTPESYFLQIERKTALLIADSCHTGAIIGNLPLPWQTSLRSYGYNLGMAFQLTDDILDFTGDASLGKATGQDVRAGIFTLPLLYAAERHPERDKLIKTAEKREKTEEDMAFLFKAVKVAGGLEYTSEVARRHVEEALNALEDLPEGVSKSALTQLARGITLRRQ